MEAAAVVNKIYRELLFQVSQIGTASGTVHHVDLIGESDNEIDLVGGNVVTSRPLILVAKEQKKIEEGAAQTPAARTEGCRAYGTKTTKIEKILGALGEQKDSRDMAEVGFTCSIVY